MKITPETKSQVVKAATAAIPLGVALLKAWGESRSPTSEPEVVDTETGETVVDKDDPTFNGDSGSGVEEEKLLQTAMKKILPQPVGLVTTVGGDGEAPQIAWNSALPVMDLSTDFLVWGFCHLLLQGFVLPDDPKEWIAELTKAAQRAVLDWNGVGEADIPVSYRDAANGV